MMPGELQGGAYMGISNGKGTGGQGEIGRKKGIEKGKAGPTYRMRRRRTRERKEHRKKRKRDMRS